MSRPLRIQHPGDIFHVICRGVARTDIFTNDCERERFLQSMRVVFLENTVRLLSYCLMTNHIHLLVCVGETALGASMQRLLTRHALDFNRTHDRVGHLFQDRYHTVLVRHRAQIARLVAYIHMNPVRAELARDPADWRWSSHNEFMSGVGPMLDFKHLEDVADLDPKGLRESYMEALQSLREARRDIESLIEKAALSAGVETAALRGGAKGAAATMARRLVVRWGVADGYTLAELARALGCTRAALWQLARTL